MTTKNNISLPRSLVIASGIILFCLFISFVLPNIRFTKQVAPADVSAETNTLPPDNGNKRFNSDATMMVRMSKTYTNDKQTEYKFVISEAGGSGAHTILTKVISGIGSMSLPFNSWSPDSAYVYIQDVEKGGVHVLVLKASGEDMREGEKYIDAADLFRARETGYTFDEVTGWASPTLLIVNTKTSETQKGPSFWFEVTDNAVIELSTRF